MGRFGTLLARTLSTSTGLFAAAALMTSAAGAQGAQGAHRITLKPADAPHPEEFTTVSTLRELRDGRVLVADQREQKLLLLDFAAGTATPIGRRGAGPGEYGMVAVIHPMAGDSSLMADVMSRRWLLFDGSRIVVTIPPDDSALKVTQGFAYGADQRGNVLGRIFVEPKTGVTITDREDSTTLTLVSRRTGAATPVVRLRAAPRRLEVARKPDGTITSSSTMVRFLMTTEEQAILFADGWLGVARLEPFRVDWRSPEGRWTLGAPLPVQPRRIDARERAAYEERRARTAARQTSPQPSPPPGMPGPPTEFAEFVPPFPLGRALMHGPGGTLIIQRAPSADVTLNQYLVVDRRGVLLGEIILPLEQAIVGAGLKHVYVTVRDEDDLLRIRRHPWP